MTTSFPQAILEDARLRILQGLEQQTDHRLSDRMMVHQLDSWGHRRSRDFVRTQMRSLAEVGALRLVEDTSAVMIGELTQAGYDHVRRRGVIDGVKRPDPGE